MSMSSFAVFLLEGMMEKGLPYVASEIEQKIGCSIQISDNLGQLHYPYLSQESMPLDKVYYDLPLDSIYLNIPQIPEEGKYSYTEENQLFCYHLGYGSGSCFINIESLPNETIPFTVSVIQDADIAMKWYFTSFAKIRRTNRRFEKELMEYFFFRGDANTKDIFRLNNWNYDAHKPYYIQIIDIDQPENDDIQSGKEINIQVIRSYIFQYCKRDNDYTLPMSWGDNKLVLMVPCEPLDSSEERLNLGNSQDLKEVLDTKFHIVTSIGIGKVYQLLDIQKSFVEANIALRFVKFFTKKGQVQKFSDLGIFSLIFSLEVTTLKEYCQNTLQKLIDFDQKNNGEFMATLDILVKNNFNRKLAADKLFIHPNTLYYRLSKIEHLLNLNLSDSNDCLEVFAVTVVYDVLKDNNWITIENN